MVLVVTVSLVHPAALHPRLSRLLRGELLLHQLRLVDTRETPHKHSDQSKPQTRQRDTPGLPASVHLRSCFSYFPRTVHIRLYIFLSLCLPPPQPHFSLLQITPCPLSIAFYPFHYSFLYGLPVLFCCPSPPLPLPLLLPPNLSLPLTSLSRCLPHSPIAFFSS